MNKLFYVGLFLLCTVACETSPYKRLKEKELARGIRIDSMPFGLKLGGTKKDFYATCWELNKTGEIMAGPGNEFARHYMEPKEENGKRIDMLFYGIFNEADTMTGFRMRFSYTGWSPWAEGTKPRTQNSDRGHLDEMVSWKRIHGCGFEARRYVCFL